MFLPAVTTRSGQLLELSIKSDEILKFAICSVFSLSPLCCVSDTSLRLLLCVRTGSRSASHADYIMTCEGEILLSFEANFSVFSLVESPQRELQITAYKWSAHVQCRPTVWLQIIFCSCVKETVLFSFLRSLLRENGRSLRFPRIFIKKINSVIEW